MKNSDTSCQHIRSNSRTSGMHCTAPQMALGWVLPAGNLSAGPGRSTAMMVDFNQILYCSDHQRCPCQRRPKQAMARVHVFIQVPPGIHCGVCKPTLQTRHDPRIRRRLPATEESRSMRPGDFPPGGSKLDHAHHVLDTCESDTLQRQV